MPQAHQIDDRAGWIVDADQLAGRALDAGKAQLERRGVEPEDPRRRERDTRRPARLWRGELDRGRDLIGQIVYRRRQAGDGARSAERNGEEVGIGGQRCLDMAEDPTGQSDDRARVPRGIKVTGMDTVRYRPTVVNVDGRSPRSGMDKNVGQ